MYNLRRFYNQNRKGIWLIVVIIASFLILLQLLNYWAKMNAERELANPNINANNTANTTNSIANAGSDINKDKTVLGESKPVENKKEEIEIINQFIDFCKTGAIEEAYGMLTDECKEEMYSTIESFQQNYVSKIFTDNNISVSSESWVDNTYKVDFVIGNMLSTGNVGSSRTIQDYITIENTTQGNKLNINRYIKRNEINKENEKDQIKITVLESNTYMDYVSYNIRIENNSNQDILLDTRRSTDSMYIVDENNVKYSAYAHELTEADLTVTRNSSRTITVKYYSSYTSDKIIKQLVFSGVIADYNTTTKMINTTDMEEIGVNI